MYFFILRNELLVKWIKSDS